MTYGVDLKLNYKKLLTEAWYNTNIFLQFDGSHDVIFKNTISNNFTNEKKTNEINDVKKNVTLNDFLNDKNVLEDDLLEDDDVLGDGNMLDVDDDMLDDDETTHEKKK